MLSSKLIRRLNGNNKAVFKFYVRKFAEMIDHPVFLFELLIKIQFRGVLRDVIHKYSDELIYNFFLQDPDMTSSILSRLGKEHKDYERCRSIAIRVLNRKSNYIPIGEYTLPSLSTLKLVSISKLIFFVNRIVFSGEMKGLTVESKDKLDIYYRIVKKLVKLNHCALALIVFGALPAEFQKDNEADLTNRITLAKAPEAE